MGMGGRVPALDGVRGVAILGVLLYHAGWLPEGQHGVDVFFVLSGYLITGILAKEQARTGAVRLSGFYRRRVARLAPALLLALIVAAAALTMQGQGRTAATVALGGGLYVGNFIAWLAPLGLTLGMMGPLWSLAVEEQFYLLWPALFRKLGRPVLTVSVLLCLSWVLRIVLVGTGHDRHVYFSTDTRAAGLLLGCLIALWQPKLTRPGLVAPLALACVLLAMIEPSHSSFAYLASMGVAESATALLLVAVTSPSRAAGWLSARWLAGCGRISYGLYVYSNVILILLGVHLGHSMPPWLALVWLAATFATATVAFRCFEEPLRQRLADHRGAQAVVLRRGRVRVPAALSDPGAA